MAKRRAHAPSLAAAVSVASATLPAAADPVRVAETEQPPVIAAAPNAPAPAVPPPTAPTRQAHRFSDAPKSRDIDSMPIDELRVYARQIGMTRRDAEELAEHRLRAGAKSFLAEYFEALTED